MNEQQGTERDTEQDGGGEERRPQAERPDARRAEAARADAPAEVYDVVVIGGGPVGENAADYAIRGTDRTAALVEAERYGGECSYWACMPSKALLHPLDVIAEANHLSGVEQPVRVSPEALLARRDEWVSHYDDAGQEEWTRSAGIVPVRGRGRIAGPRLVEVEGQDGSTRRIEAREAVVLATGSAPVVPEALRGIAAWGSRDATGVREVPERLAIVGGGVVACEAARWMSALGSRVTMLVRGGSLLGSAEPFAGEAVAASLREQGVRILFGVEAERAERPAADPEAGTGVPHGGPARLFLTSRASSAPGGGGAPSASGSDDSSALRDDSPVAHDESPRNRDGSSKGRDGSSAEDAPPSAEGEDSLLTVDEVLIATGRRPVLEGLGLDGIGLSARELRGWTHAGGASPLPEWLYLVGDAAGEAPLTHWGKYRARQVGLAIASAAAGEDPVAAFDPGDAAEPVPQVVFTDPQVSWVGRTAAAAREAGVDVVVHDADYASAAGAALLRDDASGRARLVVEAGTGELIGASFVGPGTAELLHSATVAVVGRMTLETLRHAVPSYPTASEIWLRLLDAEPRWS
ncbi:dihydrolipoyl dehydrogenase family protein [Rothia halotolerans]|uniref:dihydrolipoyl dehydrogenase family protein n=1 Tax=Rothia halotolerans TaxID=405770 RepID=UPI00101CB1FB|nr:NAD(P)/FAD-dependent oxidoreductase [Rothia halotolerans]